MGYALRKEDLPNYTYDDYAQWEGRWELIDGVAYAMSPSPTFFHQRVSHALARLLEEALEACPRCQPVLDFDWKINDSIVVCPDNMVICHEPEDARYLTHAPALIFEIRSPSTASRDAGLKFRLYEAEGVAWYVQVDPDKQALLIHRLHEGQYVKQADLSGESFEFDLEGCRFTLDFSCLWRKKGSNHA